MEVIPDIQAGAEARPDLAEAGDKGGQCGWLGTEIASDGSDTEPCLKPAPTAGMVPVSLSRVSLVFIYLECGKSNPWLCACQAGALLLS